jgi:MFS family permease
MSANTAKGLADTELTGTRARWFMFALLMAELVSTFEGSMIYAALSELYRVFGDPAVVTWLLTGYMLVASASAAICSRLGDMYGRKRVLVIVLAASLAGSCVSALSSKIEWIIAGRCMQGLAGAILPLCYGLAREHLPQVRVPASIGLIAAMVGAGSAAGLVLGGVLVDMGGWQYIFVCSAIFSLLSVLAVVFLVPRGSGSFAGGSFDWIGGMLFLPGLVLVLYAIGFVENDGFASPEIALPLTLGVAILAVWFLHEWRHASPLIDVRLMADRQIGLTLAIMALLGPGILTINQILFSMIQQPVSTGIGLGMSATFAGTMGAIGGVCSALAGALTGQLAARRTAAFAMKVVLVIAVLASIGLALFHSSVIIVGLWMAILSGCSGAAFAGVPILIVEAAPRDRTSEATGLAQIIRKVTMAIGSQIVGLALASSAIRTPEGHSYPDAAAYALGLGWVAGTTCLGFLLALFLPRGPGGPGRVPDRSNEVRRAAAASA